MTAFDTIESQQRPAGPDVYPVSEVARYLRELLEHDPHVTDIWIAGEVSNVSRPSSGHVYFTLKDAHGALRCAFFRTQNAGQRERVEDGTALVVHGSLSLYEARGDLSLIVDFVQPEGTGALQAEFERRRASFEAEGLFAPERKRPLPRFPHRIGVVTSPSGAVFHDIQTVLARRWPLATLLLQPTPVQGPEAAPLIASAIRSLDLQPALDVMIVARGGGSAEDLWPFNEEPVVRACFGARSPVISAVGHETDTTLVDLVADVRAATPSAAAELVSPERADMMREVDAARARGKVTLTRRLAETRERVDAACSALERELPSVAELRQRVSTRVDAALNAARGYTAGSRERTAALAGRLAALSPLATLGRGYAIVERADGTAATSARALDAGERVTLRLHDGDRAARIEDERDGRGTA